MLTKIGLFLIMTLALPTFANAWTITARVGAGAGAVYDGATALTPTPGSMSLSNSVASKTLRVKPSTGSSISQVVVDGKVVTGTSDPDGVSKNYTVYYNGLSSHSITAYFVAQQVTVTTLQAVNGTLTIQRTAPTLSAPTTGNLTMAAGSKIKIVAIPSSSYRVSKIMVGATEYVPAAPLPAGAAFTVLDVTINSSTAVSAAYVLVPTVNPSLSVSPASGFTGASFTFDASGTTSNDQTLSYAFTVFNSSGTAVHERSAATASTDSYLPDLPGIYSVTMTATTSGGGSASRTASFEVLDRVSYETQECSGCHSNSTPAIVALYNASPHAGKKTCQDCHGSTPHGMQFSAEICMGCHAPHSWPSINICLQCHNAHNPNELNMKTKYPHFSSYTTAQYVTANIKCENCHSSAFDQSFNVFPANEQWARSGKANPTSLSWTAFDFKMRGAPGTNSAAGTVADDCVRCHTTTGYINSVSSNYTSIQAWGSQEDRTREMIGCKACHVTPFDGVFSTRGWDPDNYEYGPPQVRAYYNYSSQATGKLLAFKPFPYIGRSNICVACHTGKASGDTIKAVAGKVGASGAFWQNVDFISPHSMGAAGVVYNRLGYLYRDTTAYGNPSSYQHYGFGNGDVGSCVTCHMSAPQKHLFTPFSTAGNGVISSITTSFCAHCHAAGTPYPLPDGAAMQRVKDDCGAALKLVARLLEAKNIYFNPSVSPNFFSSSDPSQHSFATRTRNWEVGNPVFKGSDLMGAAFNLKLLYSDGGAWAHNSFYTKRLLYDTVDFLDDGLQNSSVHGTVSNLPVSEAFPLTTRQRALEYIDPRP